MGCDEYASAYHYNGLNVIVSAEIKSDGLEWLHVSFSRTSRIPDYKDIQMVKRDFIGNDKKQSWCFPMITIMSTTTLIVCTYGILPTTHCQNSAP